MRRDGRRRTATSFEDRPDGIARDRWDVAVETVTGTVLIECGAIRERVSQELARAVFDAMKQDMKWNAMRNDCQRGHVGIGHRLARSLARTPRVSAVTHSISGYHSTPAPAR